ncbi:MAG: hypothetical protein IT454_12350 [Planctomycetes bacterium]|nr:hypothetical protein [Planctomycetota bacterium]
MASGIEGASCPSAQPDMDEARVFGVVTEEREGQRIAYLAPETNVDPALLAGLDGVAPTEVFRFSAKCETSRCSHFDGARCTLAERIKRALAPVVDRLPACTVRATCRWYLEQGGEICLRCPQVVTLNVGSTDSVLRQAATAPA